MSLAGEGVCGGWWRGGRHSGSPQQAGTLPAASEIGGYVGGVTAGPPGWQIVKNRMKSS